ncbi:dynein axonemal heavy chain 3-like [Hyalella azteca]|uniref:Dynein axonemal heavy chain 3-like n=1 Tax=Hyalella azteca TaxID=294128 RepID=A0A979FIU5_HYAAZ|nr:dynein axonemal heavy chain 3-like [Hyalella azteca]
MQQRSSIVNKRDRYVTGLQKLQEAEQLILELQIELKNLQPQLQQTSCNTEALMIRIEQDTVIVEKNKELVAADEAVANRKFADAQAIKDDCERELAKAVPALSAATLALNTLRTRLLASNWYAWMLELLTFSIYFIDITRQEDVRVVKAMKNPPFGVKLVLEAVCVMLDVKPVRVPDPAGSGKRLKDFWTPSQKLLGDLKFLPMLMEYDKDNIPEKTVNVVREKYYNHPDFDPKKIRSISAACEGLCRWVRAMVVYDQVIKIVAPKKEALEAANQELAIQNSRLEEKRKELREVTDKLQSLNDEFTKKQKEKKDLEDSIVKCEEKRDRASRITGGLGGERDRWSAAAAELSVSLENILGDSLLAAAVLEYLAPFTVEYRHESLERWRNDCVSLAISYSPVFCLQRLLADPVEVRSWHLSGLPVDKYSVDNAIIATSSPRWPLIIDPQGEAVRFINSLGTPKDEVNPSEGLEADQDDGLNMKSDIEARQNQGNFDAEVSSEVATPARSARPVQVIVCQATDSTMVDKLEAALRDGATLLLENVTDSIDPVLDPVLLRQTFKQQGVEHVRIGDAVVEFNSHFRLFMTTRLSSPDIPPHVAHKVSLLNFSTTELGLESQLLGLVVGEEKPQLEYRRNQLLLETAKNRRDLQETQDEILRVLSTAGKNLLEDEMAIDIMASSRALSKEIASKEVTVRATNEEIENSRITYRDVASHAARVFFCVVDMSSVDVMYQFSLPWFLKLYLQAIRECGGSDDRIHSINGRVTSSVYAAVSRCLFEKHKLLFSLLLAARLYLLKHPASKDTWNYLLSGGSRALEIQTNSNPCSSWLPDTSWRNVLGAATFPSLATLQHHLKENSDQWQKVYGSSSPHKETLPEPYAGLGALEKLAIIKCLRPDALTDAVQDFVLKILGEDALEVGPTSMASLLESSTCTTPLVLLLAPGSAPLKEILRLAQEVDVPDDLVFVLSIGQGQEIAAEDSLHRAAEAGGWLVLQNCHLSDKSWLQRFAMLCNQVCLNKTTHGSFRLWMTSYPSEVFPVTILQEGVKMSCESPWGMRANILHTFNSYPVCDQDFYDSFRMSPKAKIFKRLLFGLSFFHALILERRAYGALGWNVPYQFTDADFRISALQLKFILEEASDLHSTKIDKPACSPEIPGSSSEPKNSERSFSGIGKVASETNEVIGVTASETIEESEPGDFDVRPQLDALKYLAGECNYGGKITDARDRRLLHCLLAKVYNEAVCFQNGVVLGEGFTVPDSSNLHDAIAHAWTLPVMSGAAVLGLHPDCDTVKRRDKINQLFESMAALEHNFSNSACLEEQVESASGPQKGSPKLCSSGTTVGDPLLGTISDLLQRLPERLDGLPEDDDAMLSSDADKKTSTLLAESMRPVLRQEISRYNELLSAVRADLYRMRDALSGETAMTPAVQASVDALRRGEVPPALLHKSYLSKNRLAPYVDNLEKRLQFTQQWAVQGAPPVFWLGGLAAPQGFLTALRQHFARALRAAIDDVSFSFTVTDIEVEDIVSQISCASFADKLTKAAAAGRSEEPSPRSCDGVYVWGFYLEGAKWDRNQGCLVELDAGCGRGFLPVMCILPRLGHQGCPDPEVDTPISTVSPPMYECPVYRTSDRRGQLSTLGHCTNYVFDITLSSGSEHPHTWVMRGVAALLQP